MKISTYVQTKMKMLGRSLKPCIFLMSATVALAGQDPPWRTSLDGCWTNVSCRRALTVAHGGEWNLQDPYDSLQAFENAFQDGSDAVKGDFRVTKDNVGVVCHSSPIEAYESPLCVGRRIKNMTAAQVQRCPMAATNRTFITVPTLLDWARGKQIVMLCVKDTSAAGIARAISTLIEEKATRRAFLEIKINELIEHVSVAKPPGWDQVYYLAECNSMDDLTRLLASPQALLDRIFTVELDGNDPTFPNWGGSKNVTKIVTEQLHPRNMRSFAASKEELPSIVDHVQLWNEGIDVVMTYNLKNAVMARIEVDKQRGILPP
jgi:glycerophosphoryl diester phosphodiesterase